VISCANTVWAAQSHFRLADASYRRTLGLLGKQDNVHTNTESVQCISTVCSRLYVRI